MASVETPATWQRQVEQRGIFWRKGTATHTLELISPLASFSQDPAVPTPARTMGRARSSLQPDEETFSTSTSASASPASREPTARSVSYLLDVIHESELLLLSCAPTQLHIYIHRKYLWILLAVECTPLYCLVHSSGDILLFIQWILKAFLKLVTVDMTD